MNYALIRQLDISNGEGIGVALFVQGCHFHCRNCFNQETWDFYGGKVWTDDSERLFLKIADKPYIKRISILGGEPIASENVDAVLELVCRIRSLMPQKMIWLYTGYTWEDIWDSDARIILDDGIVCNGGIDLRHNKMQDVVRQCDVLVDGQYIDEKKDLSLKWRGSSNQRVIDVQKSLQRWEVVLWEGS